MFVSHATGDVKALGDRALWLDTGRLRELGETDRVVAKYLAAMTEKDSAYLTVRKHNPAVARNCKSLRKPSIRSQTSIIVTATAAQRFWALRSSIRMGSG